MIEPILDAIKANTDPQLYPFILMGMMGATVAVIFASIRMMSKMTIDKEAKA